MSDIVQKSYSIQEIQKDPLVFMENLVKSNSDNIISYNVEGQNIILVNDPHFIKIVLQTENKLFVKNGTPELMMLKPILGNGLLTSTGSAWREQRKVARHGFTMAKVSSFVKMMIEETLDLISTWEEDDVVDIEVAMSELTLRVVSKALFGNSLNEDSNEFSDAVRKVNLYMGHFDPEDHDGRMEFGRSLHILRTIVKRLIEERRVSGSRNNDFLDDLLDNQSKDGFSEIELVDQVFTYLMAGHETTAKTLTWAIYELYQNPSSKNNLHKELTEVLKDDLPSLTNLSKLKVTWNILRESMRLNPPVWVISRTAVEDYTLGDKLIKKGSLVLASPYLIHRHKDYWKQPLVFDESRFEEHNMKDRPIYSFIPFSGGPRHCVGQNFASMEVIVVLAILAQKFDFDLMPNCVIEKEALVTLRPKYGLKMRISKR